MGMIKEGVWYNKISDEILVIENSKFLPWIPVSAEKYMLGTYNVYDRLGEYRRVELTNTKDCMEWIGEYE